MKRITAEDIVKALKEAEGGVDVYHLATTKLYRDLESLGLVGIGRPVNPPEAPTAKRPYFGCLTTALGKRVIWAFDGRKGF
jgi:hypothetical protein